MFPKGEIWDVACELARSGAYENIVTIERELRRRALLNGVLTQNTYWREYLTRLCHTARDGFLDKNEHRRGDPAIRAADPVYENTSRIR